MSAKARKSSRGSVTALVETKKSISSPPILLGYATPNY